MTNDLRSDNVKWEWTTKLRHILPQIMSFIMSLHECAAEYFVQYSNLVTKARMK